MSYLEAIKTAILVFPVISFLFTIPFILHQYHKYGSINKLRVLIIYSFILYLITIYFLVILPLPSKEEVANRRGRIIQLIPFSFVGDITRETNFKLTDPSTYIATLSHPSVYTFAFNIVMTIPLGMYLRYYYKCSLKKTLLLSFALSFFFEFTQLTGLYGIYPRPYRLCDVDDLITNTLGGGIGYWIMGIIDGFLPTRDEIDEETIEEGKKVSGLRRITLFFLDSFLFLCLSILLSLFFKTSFITIVSFIIYYVVIPYFWNGKTIAGNFLNVKVTFPNLTLIRLLFRAVFYYLYYFMLPIFLVTSGMIIVYNVVSSSMSIWVYLSCFILVVLFYFINIVLLLKNGKIYYDKFLKITYQSTIEEKKRGES